MWYAVGVSHIGRYFCSHIVRLLCENAQRFLKDKVETRANKTSSVFKKDRQKKAKKSNCVYCNMPGQKVGALFISILFDMYLFIVFLKQMFFFFFFFLFFLLSCCYISIDLSIVYLQEQVPGGTRIPPASAIS